MLYYGTEVISGAEGAISCRSTRIAQLNKS